jgi:ribosomal protein S18 acetylase RimI-like enzyme
MWRQASAQDDESIVQMCMELYREDPGVNEVPETQIRRTLQTLREEPVRGKMCVLELNGQRLGYAILISFWSNELGGEVCYIDELFVRTEFRNKGNGRALVQMLMKENSLWPRKPVSIDLEVTPKNERARKLYSTLGFHDARNAHMRFKP